MTTMKITESDAMQIAGFLSAQLTELHKTHPEEVYRALQAAFAAILPSAPQQAEQYEARGYALAMSVLQSDLYRELNDKARDECDAFIFEGMCATTKMSP